MRRFRVVWALPLAAALAWGAIPSPAGAVQGECAGPGASVSARSSTRRADTTVGSVAWVETAARLARFADRRLPCDPAHHEALRLAARYYGFAGDFRRASEIAYRAGEQGRLTGHLTEAAESFISAATFALEAGDPVRAACAARQAALLARSPLLTPVQRMAIRGRAVSLLDGREATG